MIPQGLLDIASCVAYIFSSAGPYEGLEKFKGVVVEFDLWYEHAPDERFYCIGPDQIKVSVPHGP